jgi:hypothetical protein
MPLKYLIRLEICRQTGGLDYAAGKVGFVRTSLLGKTLSFLLKATETAVAGGESATTGSPRMQPSFPSWNASVSLLERLLLRLLCLHHLSLSDI